MAERQRVAFISAAAAMAVLGLLRERNHTVRSALAISAQSTGATLRSGLAFHI
jgi:hypothetical protein